MDESSLNKGSDYNDLPDTFIIFFCTFDYLDKGLPVYTITPSCAETGQRFNDGTTKIIINSKAAEKADGELKEFLQYMNGKRPDTAFTKKIEERVSETKEDEARRREYMNIQSFEMDARRAGIQAGIARGIAQGRSEGMQAGIAQGFSDGARQKALETAAAFKKMGIPIAKIVEGTGLTKEEIEKL
ncbi:Rpn family recombination-promoting nuclease/putative transposase [Treponema pedis]|uniref:Rpn family recombination-promoting nuclease/putative transposase n=1 Tax=Treponema pedis TaxID=409322 RepID=A0A7S7AX80_9SPIR|nr:Rpn family recombination-promoting nuclease/putative transposase [Treponema pedis]